MSILKHILTNEYANAYENAYDLVLLKHFSTPKIYTANDDISKRWYIYFSFRNPKNGKMERQTPVYGGINKHKTLKERIDAAQNLKWAIDKLLRNGYNPFENSKLDEIEKHYNIKEAFEFGLEIKKKTLSENSYSDYRIRIAKFQKWLIANGLDELLKIEHLTKKRINPKTCGARKIKHKYLLV
ncbi:hypothetical protein [Flavobacterium sp.]|uniref:hypothetical protein n=1 Tax=Flavobacterium sp. TaxID=239 RepID=UPI0040471AAA